MAYRGTTWGERAPQDMTGFNTHEIYDENEKLLKDQDDVLDTMHETILATKSLGQKIGDKLTEQNTLLNRMDDQVDQNTIQLEETMHKTKDLKASFSTKSLWIIIIVLILLMVILFVVAFK